MDISSLNEQQKEAVVVTEGPLLILAGAGSGKTRVLTWRIAYLINVVNVSPYHILAITFTNKAANELRQRIIALCGADGENVWTKTFHSTCLQILRREVDALKNYKSGFLVYDDSDQMTLIKHILKENNIDDKIYPPKKVQSMISHLKNKSIFPEHAAEEEMSIAYDKLPEIYTLYQSALIENNAMDFDDLLLQTVHLFKNRPDILEQYQNRFRYILVDEYQDTNAIQYRLIELLSAKHRNLCVVGDDDQSIYSWRGAEISNILDFQKYFPEAHVVKLEKNYRSSQNILDAAYHVIKKNVHRCEKKLWTDKEKGFPVTVYAGSDDIDEAEFVLRQIRQLKDKENYLNSDFAILCRTSAQFRVFEEALMRSRIPYQIIGGMRFYQRKEIKDIMAYLYFIASDYDTVHFQRAIQVPKRGIGDSTWNKIRWFARDHGLSIAEALYRVSEVGIKKNSADTILEMMRLRDRWREQAKTESLSELVKSVIVESGYKDMLLAENSIEAETRLENLDQFVHRCIEFEESVDLQEGLLEVFLNETSLLAEADLTNTEEDKVVLMTLHAAKGLEFPIVFIGGLEENLFPHQRCLYSSDALEEERRLCYVGMTRAMEKLFLLRAEKRYMRGVSQRFQASRFLLDLPEDAYHDLNIKHQPTALQYENAQKEEELWQVGESVHHQKWGKGVIVQIKDDDETVLTVAFPNEGIKTLIAAYAPITKA